MEAHPAVPDAKDLNRVRQEEARGVEEDVAKASAEDDPQGYPQDQVFKAGLVHRRSPLAPQGGSADHRPGVAPGRQDADDVGEGVPPDGEGADLDQDRVHLRIGQGQGASPDDYGPLV